MNQMAVAGKKSKVFVVDDHPIVRQGLTLLINREQDLTVCGEAEDAQSAMHSVTSVRPDIMVIDISLNGPDGLDLLKDIRMRHPDLPASFPCMTSQSTPNARFGPERRATS